MSQYKPYPAYKDSGVEWLGKVPQHWDVKPFKRVLELVTEKAITRNWQIGLENIESWTGRLIETNAEFLGDGISFLPNDILFGKLRPYLAKAYLADRAGEAVGDFFVLRSRLKISSTFLQKYILTPTVIDQINAATEGTKMPRASWDNMGLLPVPIPPIAEIGTITKNLDRETTRIDALITKKTRFIELLREKRQALITHAVTKGLDPNVKMKYSGVEWLGEVPEHWRVSKLKHNLRKQLSYGANEAAEQDDPENPRFIRITDLNEDGTLKADTFKSLPMDVALPFLLSDGDILLARSGTVGKSFRYSNKMGLACYAGYLICARFDSQKVISKYFWYITNSSYYWDFISGSNIQSTIQNVSGEKYGNLWIAVPSIGEQEEIVYKLEYEWSKIESLIRRTGESIELLKERRSALITAAVTGQIDLRLRIEQ